MTWQECKLHEWSGNAAPCPICKDLNEYSLDKLSYFLFTMLNALAENPNGRFKTKKAFQTFAKEMRDLAKEEMNKREKLGYDTLNVPNIIIHKSHTDPR